jgi:hypothetical protein
MTDPAAERYERELALAHEHGSCMSPEPATGEAHYLAAIDAAAEAFGRLDNRVIATYWQLLHLYWCELRYPEPVRDARH